MKKFKKVEKTFWLSIISFSVMSLCILFMPIASNLSELTNKTSLVIVGSVFWLSGITGLFFMLFVRKERKNYFRKMNKGNQNNDKSTKNAIVSCLQAKVAGCAAILSFLIFIISLFTNLKYGYISFVVLFILVFSLCMYFIFNGKNYRFIKCKKKER